MSRNSYPRYVCCHKKPIYLSLKSYLSNIRLLETPTKREISAVKKPKLWLDQDVRTPELNRVKGTLASKLDLIAIQSRKGVYHFSSFKLVFVSLIAWMQLYHIARYEK